MRIKKIKGVVKDYDWGNADFIPSLIGGYDGKPQAELWFGCHPLGEAVTEDGERLSAVIRDDKGYLGRDYDRFGGELPFLFKVLAIDRPLSLQCHPTRAQAEDGWKREAQLRAEGKEHDYQDPNPKAEVIAALSPITAMCGFRDIEVIDADLAALMPLSYARYLKAMCKDPRTLFLGLYGLSSDEKKEVLDRPDYCDFYGVLYENTQNGESFVLHGDDVLTSPAIVALARIPQEDIVQVDEWTAFDLPFEYRKELDMQRLENCGYNLAVVFSSSVEGASFKGAVGSTLWIDEVSLECE